ncbi:MAG: FkbM family methyltransferase [Marmoricola sp.]
MSLKHQVMRVAEGLTRSRIERVPGVSVATVRTRVARTITPRKYASHAWFSHRLQLESIIDELGIDLILDVGANTGQYGAFLREFYDGELHSFEPVSSVHAQLAQTAAGDARWKTHQLALGSEDGEQAIHVSDFTVFSSLLPMNDFAAEHFGDKAVGSREETISVRRFDGIVDELVPDFARRKVLLKLDTQGFDLEAFRGVGDRISNVVAMQSEVSLQPIYAGMPHWTESVRSYEDAGFGVSGMFPVTRDGFRVIEYDCLLVRG